MNKLHTTAGLMLLALVLAPSLASANSEYASDESNFGRCNADPVYEEAFVGKATTGARVRSVACMDGSKILTTVPAGTAVKILAKTDGWYKVKTSSGEVGWMGSWLVKKSDAKFVEKAKEVKKNVKKEGNLGEAVSAMEKLSLKDLYLLKEKLLNKIELAEQKRADDEAKAEAKKIEVEEVKTNGSIVLTGESGVNEVKLNWTLNDMTSQMGFKVVVADHENPVYPGDEYHYYSDAGLRTDTWSGLSAGVHYFRVCEYLGGKCGVYSNNLKVTVSQ